MDARRDAEAPDGPAYHTDYLYNAEDDKGSPTRMSHAASVASSSSLSAQQHFGTPAMGSTRVDRLLMQHRIRKTQSNPALFGDGEDLPPPRQEGLPRVPSLPHMQQRLIVVANRLPVNAGRRKDGGWRTQQSAGGLVSALMSVGNFQTVWVGWPGVYVDPGPDRDALTATLARDRYVPVFLDPRLLDLHYNGFCNSVLWQLFHYVPLNIDSKLQETQTLQVQWQAHQEANRRFAEVVFAHYREGDVVWVQDYHLMLLPALLKMRKPKMKVGWFLHTPFPSSEIYRTLPVREEVLRAVLKADLIGFHTYDYARHFVSACTRILGLEGTPEGVEDSGTLTRIAAFPIGIDPERFQEAVQSEAVQARIAQLRRDYGSRKVMLGVDRLDMIKGIPQKLLAFEKFLEEHPEWNDKVCLVQIAVPTRTEVPEYQRLTSMVHEIVGRINGKFSKLSQVPIFHLDRQLGFDELCALYAVTDVLLVTSLRDGMNLVSYEYVACQDDNAGVLVLSEFAGAAQSLGAGAILVNPWNIIDMAAAIDDALNMGEEERRQRHRQNHMHVTIHTAQMWADNFITELNDTHVEAELRTKHIPPQLNVDRCVGDFASARRRLLVLGYNATLTTSVDTSRLPKRQQYDQYSTMTRVHPGTLVSLERIAADPHTTVVIFSGSDRSKLEEVFGSMPVWLVAENGVFYKLPGADEWAHTVDTSKRDWMGGVQEVVDYFMERTPRSFVETRETSVVWNYKYADVEFGRLQARDLLQHLWTGPISNAPVDIVQVRVVLTCGEDGLRAHAAQRVQGAKSVEVRPVGVSKGLAMERVLAAMGELHSVAFDYVLVAGHFLIRDENVFTLFEGGRGASPPASPSTINTASVRGVLDQFQPPSGRPLERKLAGGSGNALAGLYPGCGRGEEASQGVSLPLTLPPRCLYTCTVGRGQSQARYFLNSSTDVAKLLNMMRAVLEA